MDYAAFGVCPAVAVITVDGRHGSAAGRGERAKIAVLLRPRNRIVTFLIRCAPRACAAATPVVALCGHCQPSRFRVGWRLRTVPDDTAPSASNTVDDPPRLTRRFSHTLAVLLGVAAGVSLVLSVIP